MLRQPLTFSDYLLNARAPSTVREYLRDWRRWQAWCLANGHPAMPAERDHLLAYLADRATTVAPATVIREVISISALHGDAGHPSLFSDPVVARFLEGVRRVGALQRRRRTAPIDAATLDRLTRRAPSRDLADMRDRALILVGFATGQRGSELGGMEVENLSFVPRRGVLVTIPQSKTDQTGKGQVIAIPYFRTRAWWRCPVRALRRWLDVAGITSGPIFRPLGGFGQRMAPRRLARMAVTKILRRRLAEIGFDPRAYSSKSFRVGVATELAWRGASDRQIMRITRHRSPASVSVYTREVVDVFRDHPLTRAGF